MQKSLLPAKVAAQIANAAKIAAERAKTGETEDEDEQEPDQNQGMYSIVCSDNFDSDFRDTF